MDYIYSIILGIVQGLTEFLPISSSGHLVIAHDLLNFGFVDNLSYDVALHVGTLLALILFFWRDFYKYIIAFFKSLAKWDLSSTTEDHHAFIIKWSRAVVLGLKNDFEQRMSWFLIIGSIPAGVAGFLLESRIDSVFRNLWLVAILLALVGVLFIIFERISKKTGDLGNLSWKNVIVIGLAQALALLPGVSRSGITILAGLSQKLKREEAARFSFLLAIPVVFGAGIKKIFDAAGAGLTGQDWLVLLIGLITAAVVGYLVIKFLLKYLASHSLNIFAYYRFLLAAVVILWLVLR